MKLIEIAKLFKSTTNGVPGLNVEWLLTDSRSLFFPEESLFFALKTERNDGHHYIGELYRRGVRAFVVNEIPKHMDEMRDAFFIQVEDTLAGLQRLAAFHRSTFKIPVVGITGSNGKTVVKEWLYQLLQEDFKIVRSPRSYNSQIGVPLSVWQLGCDSELALFEAGISMPGEMDRLEPIVMPTIGLFTNLGEAHQEGFIGMKQKAEEKVRLFRNASVLIYNSDDKLLDIVVEQANLKAALFKWGTKSTDTLQVVGISKESFGVIDLRYEDVVNRYQIPFTDDASIENAIHVIAVMLFLDFSPEQIAGRLQRLEPVAMRLEVKKGINGNVLINDSYNSDLNSLGIALNFLEQQNYRKNLPGTVILSDMHQTGLDAESLYKRIAELVHSKNITRFIGVGEALFAHQSFFQTDISFFFKTTRELLDSDLLRELNNSVILLKAARSFRFEDLLSRLEMTVHETTLDVNLRAFINNFNYFRSLLQPDTKVMSVVKAYGYGSGAVEIAKTLQNNRCDYLAVAVADEGAELRREGIRIPIVVMNPEKHALDTLIRHRLEPEIYSFRLLDAFVDAVEKEGLTDYPVHLKVNTGMNRLGFEIDEIPELIERLESCEKVSVRSLFSHLIASEDPAADDFTEQQIALFVEAADLISARFEHKILRHILNSAGIERFPQHQMDMVRLGIGLHQVSALPEVKLEIVSTLKTVILQIRNVKAGDSVGYGRNGVVERDSRIGVIPIGYADGLNRKLGNGVGVVWVNNSRVPIVGNVCMDACMIDLTDVRVEEGDAVEVFGEHISISEIAIKLDTIPYEILTTVSRRVKRVYFLD